MSDAGDAAHNLAAAHELAAVHRLVADHKLVAEHTPLVAKITMALCLSILMEIMAVRWICRITQPGPRRMNNDSYI